MITIDVCMETVFTDRPLMERVAPIADAGFKAVELWFPELHENCECPELKAACDKAGLKINNIVANSPDGGIGGSLTNPRDRSQYLTRVEMSLKSCNQLDAPMMITCTGNIQPGLSQQVQRQSVIDGLKAAGDLAAKFRVMLVVEPLNSRVDHHGYFLDDPDEAADIVRKVNHPNVKLLFDIYHMQIMRGHIIETIRANLDVIRHFHSAGVPGRQELDTGELNYPQIVQALAGMGYNGCFGLEYFPVDAPKKSAASLRRMRNLLPDR
jgi:hydroxypyruvate isomerase